MKHYKKWASREYTLTQQILILLPAGILFVFLIPFTLIRLLPRLDTLLHLPRIYFGVANIIIGCILLVVGLFYAYWSILSQFIRASGTPLPIIPTQRLLVSGPFKQCRNPMTFGTIIAYLGIGIIMGSISSIAFVLIFGGLLIVYIKFVEERELEMRFGQDYLEYKNVTSFIIPNPFPKK